jgi:LacI family transcriptional regulator
MTITSFQIAELCGVSRGTVDRALNNRPGIHPKTREKILKAAEELGYRPHFLAQSLVKGKTKTLGLVLFDVQNRIFSQLFHSFEAEARKQGFFVYLALSNKDPDLEIEYINNLLDRKVDGIALHSVNKGKEFESFLQKSQVPIVSFGNQISKQFPLIWINDKLAIKEAVSYISSKSYTHILYVSPPLRYKGKSNIFGPEQRFKGLLEAIKEHPHLQYSVISQKDFLSEIGHYLSLPHEKTAILCTSDMYALDVLKYLKNQKIRIPEQVGVMGFDNIDTLHYVNPALTTIDYSVDDIGTKMVDFLIQKQRGNKIPNLTTISHRIIARDSI